MTLRTICVSPVEMLAGMLRFEVTLFYQNRKIHIVNNQAVRCLQTTAEHGRRLGEMIRTFDGLKVSINRSVPSLVRHDRVVGATMIHGRELDQPPGLGRRTRALGMTLQRRYSQDRLIRDIKGQICEMSQDQADFYLFSKGYPARNCAASMNPDPRMHILFPPRPPPHVYFAPLGMTAMCGVRAGLVLCVSHF